MSPGAHPERRPWLARASAEFALIVVGVLAALALESWWGGVRDRRSEGEYIADLRDEMLRGRESLASQLRVQAQAETSLRHALILLERGVAVDSAGALVLSLVRGGAWGVAYPTVANAVFEDLRSSGRLQLIRDADLRRAIMQHYSRYETELVRFTALRERFESGLASLLTHRLPIDLVVREGTIVVSTWALSPTATQASLRSAARDLAAAPELELEIRAELQALEREGFLLRRMENLFILQEELLGAFPAEER
jgi:hypothetical protein